MNWACPLQACGRGTAYAVPRSPLQPPPELRSGGGHLGQQGIPAGQVAPSPENERSEFRGDGEGVNGHAMLTRLPDYFVSVHHSAQYFVSELGRRLMVKLQ